MLIIVGLGNPTEEYENTMHNMGFKVIDTLAEKLGRKVKKSECSALTETFSKNNNTIVLAKPQTYMNLSGQAVKSLLAKYKATPDDLLVIFDDFDLPRFSLRARYEGSGGTHNGMKNIIQNINSTAFKRIRLGIGKAEHDCKDFVLSSIKKDEAQKFEDMFSYTAELIIKYISDGNFDALMRDVGTYNKTSN